jgi:hypothetical protein
MLYGIYREVGYLDLVALVKADSYDQAVQKARAMGYGNEYRIEEEDE